MSKGKDPNLDADLVAKAGAGMESDSWVVVGLNMFAAVALAA